MQQKPIMEFEYLGLRKIISGGQFGADRGALEACRKLSFPSGGWAPRGWRTVKGSSPELAEFGLIEHLRKEYKFRTEKNIEESDGTLVIASDLSSAGTDYTIRACNLLKKNLYIMRPKDVFNDSSGLKPVVDWIIQFQIGILNVAGNRDYVDSTHHDASFLAVEKIIRSLEELRKLDISSL